MSPARASRLFGRVTSPVAMPARTTLGGARTDRLFFAQVREDPMLELEALAPSASDTVVVVSSGGCTALSLLGAGAGRVVAVDLNMTQNHLVELKAAAVSRLDPAGAIAFLGGQPSTGGQRLAQYSELRDALTPRARAHWDTRRWAIRSGVITCGVSERLIALVVAGLRWLVHPRTRIQRLLDCASLAEQREFVEREWITRRWRWLFSLLLGRKTFDRTYERAFFANARVASFADHFRALAERSLTEVPVRDNYFLHHMLTGRYPIDVAGGVPPYLSRAGAAGVRAHRGRLSIVDGSFTDALRLMRSVSVNAFALSNICEWMTDQEIDAMFAEIMRVAAPGARLCFRNFVGWTDVPRRWRDHIIVDEALSATLTRRDRSVVQPRFVACRIVREAPC